METKVELEPRTYRIDLSGLTEQELSQLQSALLVITDNRQDIFTDIQVRIARELEDRISKAWED